MKITQSLAMFNKRIKELIVDTGEQCADIAEYIDVLRYKRYCKLQSKLLNMCLSHPEQYLNLIVDKLIITAAYNKKASFVFERMAHEKYGILNVHLSLLNKIRVKEVSVGSINKGYNEHQKTRPFYNKKYIIEIVDDIHTNVSIYVADGSEGNGIRNIRIVETPSTSSRTGRKYIYDHLYRTLTKRCYDLLMQKARVTRVDVAVDLPHVAWFFCIFVPHNKNLKHSTCVYGDGQRDLQDVCETFYIGKLPAADSEKRSRATSKYRVYCPLLAEYKRLKDIKKCGKELSTRWEYELITNDNDRGLTLTNLEQAKPMLHHLKVIDPLDFHTLPERWHKELLKDKTVCNMRRRLIYLQRRLNKSHGFNTISLDKAWLKNEQQRILSELKLDMLSPVQRGEA